MTFLSGMLSLGNATGHYWLFFHIKAHTLKTRSATLQPHQGHSQDSWHSLGTLHGVLYARSKPKTQYLLMITLATIRST